MPAEWEPVRRGKVMVRGVHRPDPKLLHLEVEVEAPAGTDLAPPVLDTEWARLFDVAIRESGAFTAFVPTLDPVHKQVAFRSADDRTEEAVEAIDNAIGTANTLFETQVLPRRELERLERDEAAAEQARRLDRARERAGEF